MFTWARFVFVVSCTVAYLTIAMVSGFYTLGVPDSAGSAVGMRSMEVLLLWMLLWLSVGASAGRSKKWYEHRVGGAIITFVPLFAVLPWAVVVAADLLPQLVEDRRFSAPVGLIVGRLILVTQPLIMGAMCALCLWVVMKYGGREFRKGVCRKCLYNLTGNVSGICPECGTLIGETATLQSTIGGRLALVVLSIYIIGLFLLAGGFWLFQTANRQLTAYILLGTGALLMIALAILLRQLAHRKKLDNEDWRGPTRDLPEETGTADDAL